MVKSVRRASFLLYNDKENKTFYSLSWNSTNFGCASLETGHLAELQKNQQVTMTTQSTKMTIYKPYEVIRKKFFRQEVVGSVKVSFKDVNT